MARRGAAAVGPGAEIDAHRVRETFARHGWRDAVSLTAFPHGDHEVLGIARGRVTLRFGGPKSRSLTLAAGDVVVLPAGKGHRRIRASADLLVVGAYPEYDEPRPDEVDHNEALASIAKVRRPRKDPIYGASGPLLDPWKKPRTAARRVHQSRPDSETSPVETLR